MFSSIDITEVLWDSMLNAFLAILPVLLPIIGGIICINLVKALAYKLIDFTFIDYPAKEVRRKKRSASKIIDFISAVNDMTSHKKK